MITNFIQLDFNKENDLKVPSVQYDSGSRFVKIKLQQNKVPFEINGYRVTVVANKVDGTEIMNDCTILDGVNGIVQFEITEQFNAVEGVVDCQLKLFKDEILLTSMPFSISVVKSVSTKEIVSSNELKTLVNALGEVQNIDNRFAQTNAQLSDVEINKMDKGGEIIVSQINVNKGKLDQTYLSDGLLQQMTGNTPINAIVGDRSVTTNKLVDKSVTPNKTTFIKEDNKNLVYYSTFTKGQAINGKNGELMSAEGYVATDYIEIEPNTEYIFSQGNNLAYYTQDKVFISGVSGAWASGDKIQTTPENAKFMRCTFKEDGKDYIISKGNVLSNTREIMLDDEFEEVIVKTINKDGNPIELGSIEGFNGMIENIAQDVLFETNPSYIDPKTGLLVQDESKPNYKAVITYIPIKGKTRYSVNRNYDLAFYDRNKTFISGLRGGWSSPLTTPTNACYMRYTVKMTDTTTVANIGDALLDYDENNIPKIVMSNDRYLKAWKNTFGINDILPLNNLKWNAMGDSITSIDYSTPNYWQIISSKYEMTVNDYGFSGTTIAHTHDRHLWDKNGNRLNATSIGYVQDNPETWSTGCCFCERFSRMTDDADIITVMGGTNDNSVKLGNWNDTDTTTFYGALNTLYKGLINKYPDKIIAVFTPIQSAKCYLTNVANPSAELDKKQPTDTISIQLRAEAIKRKASQYGIPCLDLFSTSGISGVDNRKKILYREKDNLHPSQLGHEYMARVIESFLLSLI